MNIYVLYEETSDQYGTSEAVGVFSTRALAKEHTPKNNRSLIKEFVLDELSASVVVSINNAL